MATHLETTKVERLEARLTSVQKRLLQKAADLAGRSLTDFVISSAQEAARKTIHDHRVITLSLRDQEIFAKALLNPPPPSTALRTAWKRYKGLSGR